LPEERCDELVRFDRARTANRGDGIITVFDVAKVQRIREIEASS
jgi:nitrogen regulatory protein PII